MQMYGKESYIIMEKWGENIAYKQWNLDKWLQKFGETDLIYFRTILTRMTKEKSHDCKNTSLGLIVNKGIE